MPPQYAQPGPPPAEAPYPLRFDVEYPDRDLDRLSSALRFLWIIPIAIVLSAFSPSSYIYVGGEVVLHPPLVSAACWSFPTALMIIFREKYPRWWFDFNKQMVSFLLRVGVYALLIEDRYPSTDEPQGVELTLEYPDVTGELNRFMPIIKWLLAFPHYFVLFFLFIGVFFATIFAWFAILFTGRYPKDIFEFVEGVLRWNTRVRRYTTLLVTDLYPPFRLGP